MLACRQNLCHYRKSGHQRNTLPDLLESTSPVLAEGFFLLSFPFDLPLPQVLLSDEAGALEVWASAAVLPLALE